MTGFFAAVVRCALTVSFAVAVMPTWATVFGVRVDRDASDFVTALDVTSLFQANKRGDVFELRVAADRVLALEHERTVDGSDGARTWVGRLREGGSDNVVYLTEANGNVYASVPASDSIFEIIGATGQSVVVRDLAARGYRRKLSLTPDFVVPPVLGPRVTVPQLTAEQQKALPTPQVTIDVMIVYTAAFVTRHGANVTTRLNNLIAQANDSYLRSEVAITLRLVRSEQTTYANSGSNDVALGAISGFNPNNGQSVPPAPEFASIAATRNSVGADLVVLLRPLDDATHQSCGVAFLGGFNQTTLLSAYGYSVSSEGNDLGGGPYLCPDKTIQHEMGHNMGLMHDRGNSPGPDTGATPYAFGYLVPGTNPTVGDIMSYADRSVNCFSSPAVFRQGPVVGMSGGTCNVTPTTGDVLGVPASNTANSADGAAALNFTRVSVSNFRAAVSVSISGTISNGSPLANVTFCAQPATGLAPCTTSNGTGAYSCPVPNGWSGLLHAPGPTGLRIKPQSFANVTASLSGQNPVVQAIGACNLDVDNNGLIEPATDGVAILRRMLGTNSAGFSGLSGTCAANTTSAAIFNATTSNYNATGGPATLPGTDGLVILRAMQGLTGTAVTNGLGLPSESGATRTTWSNIRTNFLNSTCGADFLP